MSTKAELINLVLSRPNTSDIYRPAKHLMNHLTRRAAQFFDRVDARLCVVLSQESAINYRLRQACDEDETLKTLVIHKYK